MNDQEEEEEEEDLNAQFSVVQELVAHNAYITALGFDIDGQNLYSGDKSGTIKVHISNILTLLLFTSEVENYVRKYFYLEQ